MFNSKFVAIATLFATTMTVIGIVGAQGTVHCENADGPIQEPCEQCFAACDSDELAPTWDASCCQRAGLQNCEACDDGCTCTIP
ncbi:hypothetical protein CYLTODRAFT_486960 [Cylindrobasidium torrendii FP15055 ss-10]|uniref:Uncharacterized protein n=1 Tax=Cylindrobasidium torrendii FP15055 ss-10 TaxID=1314674 RepID=A0A0D7BMF9_9AGAR|nr:hypothetical protein CYLTODRAFT_486960 [Cylindrobasidium torrendii FP15055 ss-10]